jgi:hypothetical protein
MRLRGGKTDSETGKHVLGTPYDFKEAYANKNTLISQNGALMSLDGSKFLATSRQVYDYLVTTKKDVNIKSYELIVSRSRKDIGEGKHINAQNEVHQDVLTATDDSNPVAYILYKYNVTEGRFVLVDGVKDAVPNLELLKLNQKTLDLFYQEDQLREERNYYNDVRFNEEQILSDLENPKQNSSIFQYLPASLGGAAAGAATAGAVGAAGAGAGAGAAGAAVASIAAPIGSAVAGAAGAGAGAGAAVASIAAPIGSAVAVAGAGGAASTAVSLVSGTTAAVAGLPFTIIASLAAILGAGVAVGGVAAYNAYIKLSPQQRQTLIARQLEIVRLAQNKYIEAQKMYERALRERFNFEDSKNPKDDEIVNELRQRLQQEKADDEVLATREKQFNKITVEAFQKINNEERRRADEERRRAVAKAIAEAAAGRVADQANPARAALAAQANPARAALAAQAAQAAARQTQVPTLATVAANNAMGQRLNLLQRPDFANRSLERRRLMMMRPLRQMIRRRTPSPRRRTPSPRRRTLSPRRRTPSPRRKVTRKRKTPSLKLKRKLAAKRR